MILKIAGRSQAQVAALMVFINSDECLVKTYIPNADGFAPKQVVRLIESKKEDHKGHNDTYLVILEVYSSTSFAPDGEDDIPFEAMPPLWEALGIFPQKKA